MQQHLPPTWQPYFYPRSPCGERPCAPATAASRLLFLSTLSLRRATAVCSNVRAPRLNFYPRSPCGERRQKAMISAMGADFYPRSPCGERQPAGWQLRVPGYFYPRSPCGERPAACWIGQKAGYFYPRSPCGERLLFIGLALGVQVISIHALLAESDALQKPLLLLHYHFYPRSPCGERPTLM